MFQSKHPHIVYHSDQKPRQLCGVSESQFRVYDNRMRREIGGTGNRTERDVRYVNQFIETALVLDKAMVRIKLDKAMVRINLT